MGSINCLVCDIFQNLLLCSTKKEKEKKEIYTGLEQLKGE